MFWIMFWNKAVFQCPNIVPYRTKSAGAMIVQNSSLFQNNLMFLVQNKIDLSLKLCLAVSYGTVNVPPRCGSTSSVAANFNNVHTDVYTLQRTQSSFSWEWGDCTQLAHFNSSCSTAELCRSLRKGCFVLAAMTTCMLHFDTPSQAKCGSAK
jgi:hypothetical protein